MYRCALFDDNIDFKILKNVVESFDLERKDFLFKLNFLTDMFRCDLKLCDVENIFPEHMLEDYKNFLLAVNSEIIKNKYDRYVNRMIVKHDLLSGLFSYNLDYKVLNFVLIKEKNSSLSNVLKSFKKSDRVSYEENSTLTGRLINKPDTPSVLTLPRKYRTIFKSKWSHEGTLMMVDFSSLEPRIAKKLTSKENYKDIYEEINNLSGETLDRSVIKRAVISTLYGSTTSLDNISKEKTESLMNLCKEFFNYQKILDLACNDFKEEKFRLNYFGRPIWNLLEEKPHTVLNNFIQSTAVDVALEGFSNLINNVDINVCRPIFIIHDAIVFDVHNSYKSKLVNIVEEGYNCSKLGHFPLTTTNFMETSVE